ncbi:cytochrome b/b6 domain-containing protein [Microbacterium jiangjiandongii]|uniref:cytochrome b/b6 domain-containing protein n=1 Tax=Microbacterium jiangjiandongii TaxID=3049071 RepID=UPI0027E35D09|nr:cytochrome b/b6 domain-containing protein [Microbacterium sp. zg.Y625]
MASAIREDGAGAAAPAEVPTPAAAAAAAPAAAEPAVAAPAPVPDAAAPVSQTPAAVAADRAEVTREQPGATRTVRRGLPRVPGGEPWPPAGTAAVSHPSGADAADRAEATPVQPPSEPLAADGAPAAAAASVATVPAGSAATSGDGVPLRRGLPRTIDGEPWPPAGLAHPGAGSPAASTEPMSDAASAPAETAPASTAATAASATAPAAAAAATAPAAVPAASTALPAAAAASTTVATGPRPPLTVPRTVWPGAAASRRPAPKPEPRRIGPFTRGQWAGVVLVGGGALLVAAAMAVFFVRWFLSLEFMQEFLTTYPGEYHLPEGAPIGFPAWLGWQHFFNAFLMVLIIRTGLQVRTEKRPTVFWTPRGDKKGKTSLNIWFHQALDVLWLANGLIFVVLLFVSGQWMRIVPTSWEVFPNALSAVLQYISLDWPTENGWVNYNSIQQLAYFTTVFIAAPLATITGYRMSGLWPKNAAGLNKAYPIDWARKLHFPVMLFFVAFIIVHVGLVFATGALRNLNHMYAAQGSVDPAAYADNWTGFWIFIASIVAIAIAWIAARPMVVAPIARLFGTVSGR